MGFLVLGLSDAEAILVQTAQNCQPGKLADWQRLKLDSGDPPHRSAAGCGGPWAPA